MPCQMAQSSTFTQFPCLPAETRLQIWNELVEPRIVTFHPNGLHPLPDNPRSLLRATFESRSVCKQNYRVRFQGEVNTLATHRMDIDRDTFRTFQMTLPTINPTSAWPTASVDPMALPIKKMMSYYPDTSIWTTLHPFLATQDPQRLSITHLPLLREQTMVFGTSAEEWWVPGFQEIGPQIINKPDDVVPVASQFTLKHHSACKSGAHFEEFNIRGDTGLHWPSPNQQAPATSNTNMYQEHLDDFVHRLRWTTRSEHYSEKFLNPSHPRVGFRGYSRNCVSTGGLWGGFRYHLASGTIEFTPLSWYEVKDAMYANLSSTDMFPEMVIKIFIVHEGEEAYDAPHHCWTKVLPHHWGQNDSGRTVRCLWSYIQWLFNQPTYLPHKMQMDP